MIISLGNRSVTHVNPAEVATYRFETYNGYQRFCYVTLKNGKEVSGEIDRDSESSIIKAIHEAWGE